MPYIKGVITRDQLLIAEEFPENCGELNFKLHDVINDYLTIRKLSYQTINDIEGAFQQVLREFNRRIVVPYEDTKIKENGDIPLYETYGKQK